MKAIVQEEMLQRGRIAMNEKESAAVDELIQHETGASLTRRDPGESGPVVVYTSRGRWLVDHEGNTERI